MRLHRIIPVVLVVLALGVATWGVLGRSSGESEVDVAASRPVRNLGSPAMAPATDPESVHGVASPNADATGTAEAPQAVQTLGAAVGAVPAGRPAAPVPANNSSPTQHQLAGRVAMATNLPTAAKPDDQQTYVDPAAQILAALARKPTEEAQAKGGSSGGTNNLAPLPGGAGLVINDGRIPVGFVINPREYAGGVLHFDNHSGTPAILTINDPAAAAACSIAGEPVVVGRPYQVDALDITATRPVTVFVQPGRAPGPPAGPKPPHSDG